MSENSDSVRSDSAATYDDLQRLHRSVEELRGELAQVIVGQREVVDQILISILSGGHSLLVGVPGLAKTMLVKSLAEVLGLSFNRIQFTPDLMPADITGTDVIQEDRSTGTRDFRFIPGPIFAQILLADEINRTPPKTQAALLEAMQERQVTATGHLHRLPEPFFVLATQNPIEQEGTYPLPEAQLDRFMLEIRVDYPGEEDEYRIVSGSSARRDVSLRQVVDSDDLLRFRRTVEAMPIAEHDIRYAIALIRATRISEPNAVDEIQKYLNWGAGPRASEWLVFAARAHAAVHGGEVATAADVQAMLAPVLRHRLVLNFNAEADGVSADDLIGKLLDVVPSPTQKAGQGYLKRMVSSRH